MVTPEMLELGPVSVVGVGGLLMGTPVLLLKLELGHGLTADDPVRLSVVSTERGAGLADIKLAFNFRGAGLFDAIPPRGWICDGILGIFLDGGSLSVFFDMVSIVISSLFTVLFTSCWSSKICSPCSCNVSSRRIRSTSLKNPYISYYT